MATTLTTAIIEGPMIHSKWQFLARENEKGVAKKSSPPLIVNITSAMSHSSTRVTPNYTHSIVLAPDDGRTLNVSAAEFLAFPSPTKLLGMGQARAAIMKQQLGYEIEDVEKVVETVMRVAAVVRQDDDKTKDAAVECADALLEGVMKRAYAASQVANAILVQLGLIKGEDKKFKPMTDISGALIVLDHVVQQSYFPKQAREILQAFISKPGQQFEKCSRAQHKLLQTLYAF